MGRPTHRLVAKSKQSGNFQDVAALWEGDRGISGQLDRDVEKIVLKNGAVLTNDGCWFNLQVANEHDQTRPATNNQNQEGPPPADETPF